jgi:hypothetical protein
MTAASGDPGERPQNEGQQPPAGGQEFPPIEQAPAYGYEIPPAPSYPDYQHPGGFPPPGQPGPNFPPPAGYPAPGGYNQQYNGGFPPPMPGYPPPEYGAPYPGGYGHPPGYPPPAQGGTNKLAIGSIVASVLGLLCGIGSIIGIVLGALALNQIKRSREGGYGLAVAGIVIGVASLLISIVWMTYAWN